MDDNSKFKVGDIVEGKDGIASPIAHNDIGEVIDIANDGNKHGVQFKTGYEVIEQKYLRLVKRPYFGGSFKRLCNKIKLPFITFHLAIPLVEINTHLMCIYFRRQFTYVMWDLKLWKWRFEFSLYTKLKRMK